MRTQFDRLVDQFESELRSGNSPPIESYLTQADEESKPRVLLELISLEVYYRVKSVQEVKLEDYARFGQEALVHAEQMWARNDQLNAKHVSVPTEIGNFRLIKEIGHGGMGIVLKAHDKKLKRDVAIKVLAPYLAADAEAVQRFVREAQSAAAVRHDNVVTIHAVDEANGSPFLVMELINGESLQDRIKRGPLPTDEIVQFGIQIALGLDAAHRRGLIHRDIKPANILLESQSELGEPNVARVKITDFGLARVTSESAITRHGFIAGTPPYMSPEQANGKPLDHRSDLFSLGSVLYLLCTGQVAFHAESAIAVLRRVTDHEPEPIRPVNPAIPDWLCEVIAKLMAKRPEDRIQSAKEVADLLTQCQADASASQGASAPGQQVNANADARDERPGADAPRLANRNVAPQGSSRGPMTATLKRTLIAIGVLAGVVLAAVFSRSPGSRSQASRSASAPGSSVAESVGANDVQGLTHPVSQDAALPAKKLHPFLDDSYEWTPPVDLGPGINGARLVDHASISSDGLLIVMTRIENRRSQLWWSVRESERDPFPAASPLPPEVNSDGNALTPFLSRDGLSLWFASNRPGGAGGSDLYVSRRKSLKDPFERPVSLGPTINTADDETSPFVTADELTLLFAAGRPRQIFQAQRKSKEDSFAPPQLLANINAMFWHEFPRLSQDGLTLVLVVSRMMGDEQRLEVASRPTVDTDFDEPVDLGPVNHGVMSGLSLSGDETTVYFSTSQTQSGARGLWMSRRVKKPSQAVSIVARLNLADIVGDYVRQAPIDDWHHGVISMEKDKAGRDVLRWTNAAGKSWQLNPDLPNGVLKTGPDNPYFNYYDCRVFTLVLSRDGNGEYLPQVRSFQFGGSEYVRKSDGATVPEP